MNRPNLLALVLLSLLLASCVEPPTERETKAAHYGRYPSNYRGAVDQLMSDRHAQLGDPFQPISMSKPQKDWMGGKEERQWGYSVVVVYQAPNPVVNAPVYIHREKLFFRNGRQVAVSNVTNLGDVFQASLTNNLNSAAQQLNGGGGDDNAGGDDDSVAVPSKKKRKRK